MLKIGILHPQRQDNYTRLNGFEFLNEMKFTVGNRVLPEIFWIETLVQPTIVWSVKPDMILKNE